MISVFSDYRNNDTRQYLHTFQVVGSAMSPNFTNGQFYFYDTNPAVLANLDRGEVVIFEQQTHSTDKLLKRIIGLPGEKIKISMGQVYINDNLLSEPYLQQGTITRGRSTIPDDTEITIPDNDYVLMGDNRQDSSDSRNFGFVPKKDIIGKVITCYRGCTT